MNAEFQRKARREENNRMGKTRDLFKKIRDTNVTFHAKMGTVKARNGMNLREAEYIKKWQEYTEELYKKHLHDPDNHDGVITHLESDILECEIKCALRGITTNTYLVAQMVKHLSTMWETWVRSLGWEDSLEKETATHSSTLA